VTLSFIKPPEHPPLNVLLYGAPKTGKTAGACSAPPGVLLLNLDLPNATHFALSQHPDGSIMVANFEGLQTMIDVSHAIIEQRGQAEPVIRTVVIDTVAELHRRLLEEASDRAVRPTLNQYGDTSTHIERFCRFCCEAAVNCVIVCHETPVRDEASGQFERLPYTGTTNPALGQKLMGMVDVVGYTGVVEQEGGTHQYVAQLVNGLGRRGGDRFNVLGDWRPLDLSEWVRVIHEGPAPVEQPLAA
jgi:hypothetical protein